MKIRFKCPHCQKTLGVEDHLAGKKAACPVCKKAVRIPAVSAPVDVEALAASALADAPAEKPVETAAPKFIDFSCPFCGEDVQFAADLGGKQSPCPKCTRVVRVPLPSDGKPKDWRAMAKTTPAAAVNHQPEQLKGAWGTEVTSRAGVQALEEAGALPVPEKEPLDVFGWIKRLGFWSLVGGLIYLGISGLGKVQSTKREQNMEGEALKLIESNAKIPRLLVAEIYRASGEIKLRKKKVAEAIVQFQKAREMFRQDGEGSTPAHEQDLLLIELALAQVELGGTEEEFLNKEKISWKEETVPTELRRTLDKMRTLAGKATCLRELGSQLLERDKAEVAIVLAAKLANPGTAGTEQRPPLLAQQVGLLLVRNEAAAAKLIKAPVLTKGKSDEDTPAISDLLARVAYTEGNARKGNYKEARDIASAKGPPVDRLEACIAGAGIALADTRNKDAADQAKLFLEDGLKAVKELEELKGKAPPWLLLQLIRLGNRTPLADQTKVLVEKLPPAFQACGQLEIFQAKLAKSTAKIDLADPDDITDKKSPALAFAWQAIARHNARLGGGDQVRSFAAAADFDDNLRPFLFMGVALGEKDGRK